MMTTILILSIYTTAEEFSIKEYLPAYLDTNLSPQDLLTGVSFASGAAGFDPLTSQVAVNFIFLFYIVGMAK